MARVASIFNPYHQWLGLPANLQRPNYYQLLGLSSREEDPQKIAAAADHALARLGQIDPGTRTRQWQQLLEIVQAAKACLTDEQRRAAYRHKLRRARQRASSSVAPNERSRQREPSHATNSAPGSQVADDTAVTDASADPMAPVQLPEPSASESNERHEFLPPAPMPPPADTEASIDPMAPVSITPLIDPMAPVPVGALGDPFQTPPRPAAPPLPATRSDGTFVAVGGQPPVAIAPQQSVARIVAARKRSSYQMPVLVGIALLMITVTVGVLYYLLSGGIEDMQRLAQQQAPAAQPAADPDQQPEQRTTTRSAAADGSKSSSEKKSRRANPPATQLEMEPGPLAQGETKSAAPTAESTVAPLEISSPMNEPPTAEEVAELNRILKEARQALGEFDFEQVDELLVKATGLAKLPEQQAQVTRLSRLTAYAQQFDQALVTALDGLEAGESITVGSTIVGVVESSSERITIRVAGMNRGYDRHELPPGLAVAIAELALPPDAPATKMIKGSYVALTSRDEQDLDKVRSWWEQAAAADPRLGDLLPVLEELRE